MRIALVCPYDLDRPGGVATQVLGLGRWLASQGHEPTVIAPGTRSPGDLDVRLLGPGRDFRFNGSVAQLAVARRQRAEAIAAVRGMFDLVHVHEPLTPGAAYAAARAAERLVVTHHAAFRVPRALRPALRRRARRLGPRVGLAVSEEALRTAWEATGLEPVVVPNAVRLPSSAGLERGDPPTVVFLGRRDDPRKGYPVFAALARSGLRAEFVAIGPGGHTGPQVRGLGVLDDAARDRVLAGADVVVAPNLGGESFGMVLVEALAAGCTLVASDLPAFRSVVPAGDLARWFPAGDAAAAETALRQALAAPSDPAAARAAAARYSWDAVGPRVLRAYREALEHDIGSTTWTP